MLDSSASGGLGVLSANTDSPPVPESPVRPDLLHPLNVLTKLGIKGLSKDLGVLAGFEVFLSVKEPKGDLELFGGLDDGHNLLNLISSKVSGTLVHINLCLLANKVGKSSAKSLNFCKGKNNVPLSLDVGIKNTQNVLELLSHHK